MRGRRGEAADAVKGEHRSVASRAVGGDFVIFLSRTGHGHATVQSSDRSPAREFLGLSSLDHRALPLLDGVHRTICFPF